MSFITDFFEDLAQSGIDLLNETLIDMMDIALNSQDYMTNHLGISGIDFDKVYSVVLTYALTCIVLKFVQKGFNIYILQADGDSDHDPFALLTGFFEAIAISITALGLYPYIINVFKKFTKDILKAMGSSGEIQTITRSIITALLSKGISTIILVIVFAVIAIILYVTLIMDGVELMVLKYAFPFFSIGLMDSDGGTFKTACKKFLQIGFTAILKIALLRLSIALLLTAHPIWAIAVGVLAIKCPKILQEFLYIRQGGGATSKLYAISTIRNLMPR